MKKNLIKCPACTTTIYLLLLIACLSVLFAQAHANPAKNIYPTRLQKGDTVALISSGFYAPEEQAIDFAKQRIEKLGLKVVMGKSIRQHHGYFAGTLKERADDINQMFLNPNIKAIFEIRGGFGSAQLLNDLDYESIQKHPKIFIGFSDITALLLAIHKKTGLVTFHGPLAIEPWPQFTVDLLKQTLFTDALVTYSNLTSNPDLKIDIIQTKGVVQTVQPGQATGELIGGNLSVLVSLLGTPYEPAWKDKILFVEEVGEKNYQIERMLVQLKNAKVFDQIKGFIFGQCMNCIISNNNLGSFTLYEIIKKYTQPHPIPVFIGAHIGHYPKNFTLPIGVKATMDARQGTIKLLHPAVS